MTNPTRTELVAALGSLLAEYAELDEMLDGYSEAHGMTLEERRRQKDNNKTAAKAQRVWRRAIKRTAKIRSDIVLTQQGIL